MNVEDLEILLPKAPDSPLLVPVWGVVTQTFPLLVQLAGDSEPLAVTPKTLVSGLIAGDVVWCTFQGRSLLVVAKLRPGTASMTRASTGPTYSASTWTQVTFDATSEEGAGITSNPAAGTFTVPPGRWNLSWRQRWQNYGSAYRRQSAIVLGTAAPAADLSNVLAGNVVESSGWLAHSLHEPGVVLTAVSVLSYWVYSTTSSTYNNNTMAPLPPVTKVSVTPA